MKWTAALWTGFLIWLIGSTFVSADNSLQQLIDSTPENGVITLTDQVYKGNLVITKPLTIKGSGQSVIDGDGKGNVILIKAPHVHLENLIIKHSSISLNSQEEFAAIKVNSDANVLKDLVISDSYHGIHLQYSDHNILQHVTVHGMGNHEIAGQGNGFQLDHSNGNQLLDNQIDETRDGIYFYYSENNRVVGNEIRNTRYGLHYMYSDNNQFYRNRFLFNTGGAAIMHSKNLVLQDNEFSFHEGTRSFGMMLQASDDNLVKHNRFFQNQRALYLDMSLRNRFEGNEFVRNQVGIELWASSTDQVFTENKFEDNISPVATVGGHSSNQWDDNGKGNDWGRDFPLLDVDQDGIGDNPVRYQSSLYQLLQENELVYLFLNSPAIHIYEKMNQILNNTEVMFEDRYPLVRHQERISWGWLAGLLLALAFSWGCWQQRRKKI